MYRVRKQREIIDRKKLAGKLGELVDWSGWTPNTQVKVLSLFKEALQAGRAEVRRRFEKEKDTGRDVVRTHAFLIDQLVRIMFDFATEHVYLAANPTKGEQMSVVAIGGYGRTELAPQSDIDLMFLLPYKKTPHTEQVVEFMLYMLWDMGLKVGHSTRGLDDCVKLAKQDTTIRTAMLDARWLWGDKDLFDAFWRRYRTEVVDGTGPDFVESKLAERNERHEKLGDSRYVLEPNLKEGKGGLRDLQTLFWITKYLYQTDDPKELAAKSVLTAEDAKRFKKARNFLWTVRCHLHYVAGRPEERLTFNVQDTLGERMGYADRASSRGVERFMKHYYLVSKDVGDLTRILCAVLEENHKKRRTMFRLPSLPFRRRIIEGFKVDGDRLTVESDDAFQKRPIDMLRLFREGLRNDLDLHPHALRLLNKNLKRIDKKLRRDPEANRLFMEMLTSDFKPARALKRMNEAGVLGRFVPDFGRVVAQMQHDMYHVYTVDEHTIRAVGVLHDIEQGRRAEEFPVCTEVVKEIQSRRVLYTAVMMHDIAKGRGGDHSVLGAGVAEKLCPRLGLNEWETQTVAWLVRNHLAMSNTAFKRDIEDPRTVRTFADLVQSPEQLKMLLVLTCADIRAVGPTVWNTWKGGLLRELYFRTLEAVSGGLPVQQRGARVEQAKRALAARLEAEGWAPGEIEAHLDLGYYGYWLTFDTEVHLYHARLVREAEGRELDLHIETKAETERGVTELTIYTQDHPGLFARIAGAVALGGGNIVDAKVVTLSNGMALDTFSIQDPSTGAAFASKDRIKRVWRRIEDAVRGKIDPSREIADAAKRSLPSRTRVFTVPPRVIVDNNASAHHTVIEVNGRDRPALLHDVTATLTHLHLQISSALVSTYGERVVDVFYVRDVFGLKLDRDEKIRHVEQKLLEALEPPTD